MQVLRLFPQERIQSAAERKLSFPVAFVKEELWEQCMTPLGVRSGVKCWTQEQRVQACRDQVGDSRGGVAEIRGRGQDGQDQVGNSKGGVAEIRVRG